MQSSVADFGDEHGLARRGRGAAVQVSGEQGAVAGGVGLEFLVNGGLSGEQVAALEGDHAGAE